MTQPVDVSQPVSYPSAGAIDTHQGCMGSVVLVSTLHADLAIAKNPTCQRQRPVLGP